MILKFTKYGVEFTLEATDERDAVEKLSFWQSLPDVCPLCKSELRLHYKNPKDNAYYLVFCLGETRHECNFGLYKKGGMYYKGDSKFEKAFGQLNAGADEHEHQDERVRNVAPEERQALPPIRSRILNAEAEIKKLLASPVARLANETDESFFTRLTAQYKSLTRIDEHVA